MSSGMTQERLFQGEINTVHVRNHEASRAGDASAKGGFL